MVIERMRPEHTSQVLALQQTLVPFALSAAHAESLYKTLQHSDDYYLAVAREGDTILGTVTGILCHGLGDDFLVIEDFVVEPSRRGQGIGTKLMQKMDDFAVSRNCTYAILVSSGFRKDAHRFYEKTGFLDDVRGFRKNY